MVKDTRRDVFQALADPNRRQLLMKLAQRPQNIQSLASGEGITRQAVSLHLRILLECGVVMFRKQGREKLYDLNTQKLQELDTWFRQMMSLWQTRFQALDQLLAELQQPDGTTDLEHV